VLQSFGSGFETNLQLAFEPIVQNLCRGQGQGNKDADRNQNPVGTVQAPSDKSEHENKWGHEDEPDCEVQDFTEESFHGDSFQSWI